MQDYATTAKETRLKVLDLVFKHQTSHIGSNFSVIDMAVVLYSNLKVSDKVVWSAGWKAATYCVLENRLFTPMLPTGSAGHGLPIAVGMALAKKKAKEKGTIYCIMSEGELNEGTTWESAAFASQHGLDNLVVLVDVNGLQAMGKTEEVINMEPLEDKWNSFGWYAKRGDGHNYLGIDQGLKLLPPFDPVVFILDTIKGKGVDFMENDNKWHYKNLTKDEYEKAILQLTS